MELDRFCGAVFKAILGPVGGEGRVTMTLFHIGTVFFKGGLRPVFLWGGVRRPFLFTQSRGIFRENAARGGRVEGRQDLRNFWLHPIF